MTRLIQAYETSDGSLHLTRSAADKHQNILLTNSIGALIDYMDINSIGLKIKICQSLEVAVATDPGGLVNVLQGIINILNHEDSSEE